MYIPYILLKKKKPMPALPFSQLKCDLKGYWLTKLNLSVSFPDL